MAVFRSFYRMIKTALFALVVVFVSLNAFGDCTYTLEPGEACVQNTAVDCAPGCYCPGGNNVSSSQEAAVLQGSCNAATPGSSITGGAIRCPSNLPYSDAGARSVSDCYGTYSSYTPQFYIETTTDTTEFDFIIQARGTFYIDCDVNNVGGLTNEQRKKRYDSHNTNDSVVIKCKYNSDGRHYKIGIASENVTEYNYVDDYYYIHSYYYDEGVIAFVEPYDSVSWSGSHYYRYSQNASHVYKISGSLGKVFPTLGTNSENQQPRFAAVFYNATNLTGTLPTNLFTGDCVYNSSTKKCSSGKGIYGRPVDDMFSGTFYNCSNLSGSIPDYFFGYLYGDSLSEYNNTEDSYDMFSYTFANCSGLTSNLSDTWFKNLEIHDPNGTFDGTFKNCTGLSGNIPSKFFGNINGELACDTDNAEDTFGDTFENTQISGTIPYDLFEGIDGFLNNNDYGTQETTESGDWCSDPVSGSMEDYETFQNTNMATSCADDEYQYISGLEIMFGNRGVICKKCPSGTYGTGGKNITSCITDTHFTITTTNMSANTEFRFMISALGSYRVDWGDGNESLMSTDVEGVEDDDEFYFSHTYTTGGVRTIKVYGNTLAYSNDTEQAAISFYDGTAYDYIEKITGSIGDVFPTVSSLPSGLSTDDFETHPGFYQMCKECSNLNSIGSDLFSGVTGAIDYMFEETFYGCFDLTIPSGLFSGITGNASGLFYGTFYDCDSIESVPSGLFSGISGAASSMFSETFYSCESLKTIPANLFSGVRGAASSLFSSTFEGCSDLEEIPVGLFANVSGAAPYMFSWTFADCDSLSDIPRELFDGVNTTAEYLFSHTFYDCDNNLTSIPADLFKNVSGTPQKGMFDNTFGDSPDIESFTYADGRDPVSYVPSTFFGALENSNYTTASNTNNWVANDMFVNTQILETCPAGTTEFNSKFKTEYAPKVSCVPIPSYNINYVLNGGTIPNSQTNPTSAESNERIDIISPTRSGYTFAGWDISGMDNSNHVSYLNNTTNNFSWTEYSRSTYTGYKNLRSSSGTVTFTAVWKKYCSSGTYYNPTTQTCTDCPSGSYCYGGTGYTDTPQIVGKETCPTGFTSNAKNSDITGCYKNGTTTCAVVNPVVVAANATSVKYATTGNIACKIYPEDDYDEDNEHFTSCIIDNPDACEVIGMNCNTGYVSTQVKSVLSSKNIPDTFSDYAYVSIDPDGELECGGSDRDCYRTDKPNGVYDVWLNGYGVVRGRSLCSSTPGTNGQIGTPSLSNGQYCWCKTTLFKENDNDAWLPAVSSWVREINGDNCTGSDYESYEYCIQDCSYDCAYHILSESSSERTSCSVAEQTVRSTLFNDSKTYICQPITYTVSFNTNGGTGGPGANIMATYDVPFNVASPTRSGYTFAGWNISGMDNSTHLYGNSSGHAEESNNSTSVTNTNYTWYQNLRASAETVTFTAQWTQNSYVVTYHAGYDGGTDPGAANYTVGGDPVILPNITRSGYVLNGWYTAASGGTKAGDVGAEYRPEGNVDLYAHWSLSSCPENAHIEGSECVCNEGYSGSPCSPITYNIRYEGMEDATFGTNHPTSATYDTLFTVDNPTKTGYKFTGWSMYLLPGTVPESVAYNVNGGTDGVSITAVPGEEATFIYYVENLIQFKNLRKTNSSTVKLTAKWTKQCGAGYDVINNNCVCVAPKIEENGVCHDVCPTGYSYKNTTAPAVLPTIEATDSRYKSLAYPSGGSSSNVEDMSNGYYNVVWESGNTKGTLVGTASCTGTTGEVRHETVVPENSFEEAENSGSNCWCKPVSWTPYGEDTQKLSSDWVFFQEDGNACARECSAMCNNFFGTSHYINQRNDVFDNVKITSKDCVPNTYTVTYDANGGSVNPGSAQYTVGGDALTLPTPIYSGYNFDGWYTASNGGTKINSPYVPLEDNIILYAHWSSTSCQENAHLENGACVCNTGTIEYTDSNNNTTTCAEDKFQLTTTEMSSGESFDFDITAAGTFYVNCGEGGTLSGQYVTLSNSGVQIGKINRENTSRSIYSCTYSNSGTHIIRFGGRATGYVDIHKDKCEGVPRSESAICFTQSASKISGITGSLGAIFGSVAEPTIGIGEPMFFSTFRDAINLTGTIPKGLFYGVTGTRDRMFYSTFHGCTGLTGDIPDFSQISGPGQACMFAYTFRGAFGLNGVLSTNSFSNITSSAKELFQSTFKDCSSLNTMSDGNGTVTNYVQAGFLNNFTGYVAQDALSNTGFDDPCPDTTYDVTQSNFRDAGKPWCTPCPSDTSNYYPNSDSGDNDSINKCYTSGSCPATIAECPDNATCHYTGNNTAGRLYYDGSKTYSCDWAQDTINLLYKYNDINDTQITSMCTYENSPFTVLGNSVERPKYRFMGWKYQKVITNQ